MRLYHQSKLVWLSCAWSGQVQYLISMQFLLLQGNIFLQNRTIIVLTLPAKKTYCLWKMHTWIWIFHSKITQQPARLFYRCSRLLTTYTILLWLHGGQNTQSLLLSRFTRTINIPVSTLSINRLKTFKFIHPLLVCHDLAHSSLLI